MITIQVWNRATRKMQALPADRLCERKSGAAPGEDDVLWIDLSNPTEEEEQLVLRQFLPIHPLSLEDVTRLRREPDAPPHFPKVEEFPDYLFVIVNPLSQPYLHGLTKAQEWTSEWPTALFTQLSAVLTHDVLITHHAEPLLCVEHLRTALQRNEGQADRGPDYLFHLILDSTVDQYAPVLDHVDDALDHMEVQVMQRPRGKVFHRLLRLKREIILLRKTLIYEREVLVRLARGEFALVDERETVYYRNVYDHLVRFTELIESSREMTSDLMQSYLASTSNHLNQIMKLLTMISTIILPMTLISGVFGMNFERLIPSTAHPYGFEIALGLMAVSGLASLGVFWWRKWL
jgi:magnesium transporter